MMSNKPSAFFCLVLLLLVSLLPATNAESTINTFHEKNQLITMFKTLCDKYPTYTSYESIGKTYENQDIWIFKIGNPNGGKVMWDGSMHGWEDMGSEIEYLFLEWLLESGDPLANQILQNNYVLFIPIVNMDSYERQNRNFEEYTYGVDLNRNFENGWSLRAPNDYSYSGPYPASEPETQTMITAFKTYKPEIYVNTHYGGGPVLYYNLNNNISITNKILNSITILSEARNVTPNYSISSLRGSNGLAIADANYYGANSWLYEVEGGPNCYSHTAHSLEDVRKIYFPESLPIFIAMCEAAEEIIETTPKENNNTIPTTDPAEEYTNIINGPPNNNIRVTVIYPDTINETENEEPPQIDTIPEFPSGSIFILVLIVTSLILLIKKRLSINQSKNKFTACGIFLLYY